MVLTHFLIERKAITNALSVSWRRKWIFGYWEVTKVWIFGNSSRPAGRWRSRGLGGFLLGPGLYIELIWCLVVRLIRLDYRLLALLILPLFFFLVFFEFLLLSNLILLLLQPFIVSWGNVHLFISSYFEPSKVHNLCTLGQFSLLVSGLNILLLFPLQIDLSAMLLFKKLLLFLFLTQIFIVVRIVFDWLLFSLPLRISSLAIHLFHLI